ncbi:MAG: alcohol dehydrogenase [Gemmatimonadales bacterium]|nr:MAG: alcohol dehydrogenase [Gemmatimonadales bacterium]
MAIRVALMTGPDEPIRITDLPDPEPGPGEVVLDTVASEVCGTDVHLWHGHLAGIPWPIIPGHVSIGRIAEARGVEHDALGERLDPGDLVTFLDVHGTCHACYQCTVAGQPNRCPSRRVYGITFPASDGLLGGWSEQILLKAGVRILKLPPGIDADRFIGGGCGLFTGFATVERSGMRMGDTVLVQGSGPVGLAAAAFAHLRGAGRVLMIGAPEARLELAEAFGVDLCLDLERADRAERRAAIMEATRGRGADVVLEASGNPNALPEGLDLLRDGGCYIVAGHYTDVGPVELNPHLDFNRKHVDLRGQWGTDFRHLAGALQMLSRHGDRLPFERVIGARYPLEKAEEALRDVEALRVTKAVMVP